MLPVDMENLISIGEFASASRLSQKALRHYGASGLLAPAWVDPDSGYRYYQLEQLREATLIALLRRAGMPLADIRAFLRAPSAERLEEYEQQIATDFAQRRRVLRYVKRVLREEPMYDVLTKRVDAQPYVSRSKQVYVRDLEPFIVSTFAELGAEWGKEPAPFVLYHGPVNEEENGPVEVCVPSAEGEHHLPAGEVAFTQISGSQCDFPEILGAYESVYRWAKQHGREADGPPRELYFCEVDAGEELRMEIALPLR